MGAARTVQTFQCISQKIGLIVSESSFGCDGSPTFWSSSCRKAPLNLQNEDPYLNAFSDVNRREIKGVFILQNRPPESTKRRPLLKCFVRRQLTRNQGGLRFVEKTPWIYRTKTLTKTLCQTPIDAKSRGSSFCRKDPLNLQNEDPY